MTKTFFIQTLGCKVNQYESDGIAQDLENRGLTRIHTTKGAEVCIINTCAVTSKAGMQSRQAIRRLIRDNPGAKIIVTGCHVQTAPDQIRKIQDIDLLVCHQDKNQIPACISQDNACDLEFRPPDHGTSNRFFSFDRPVSGTMTRAYLKIQDGCNAFCTYCIVPYARGSSVSMPEAQVHRHIKGLAEKGFQEVILTGIHTGLFGQDLIPATSLTDLVRALDDSKPVPRIRISSIEPNEITPELIALARPGHILCDHFHIPLQSGDNGVLARMKRPYTSQSFSQKVSQIHDALPLAGIGLDILVGFPGETDDQFQNTYDLVRDLPVSYLHVFPFSPRKGTPAWHFKPKVHSDKVKERCARMRELDYQKRKGFLQANQGQVLKGLVQHTPDKATGRLKAVTGNYLTLCLDPRESSKGKLIDLIYDEWDNPMQVMAREAIDRSCTDKGDRT